MNVESHSYYPNNQDGVELHPEYRLTINTQPNCIYRGPVQCDNTFLKNLIIRSQDQNESFETIHDSIEQNQSFYHQFHFKYPLKNQEHAQVFAKVLQIKAQEAHRFVPAIEFSQLISPAHLGFLREITIGGGPTIQENVLIDQASNSVIFIEKSITTKDGVESGEFAAINKVIEENGHWYFAGTYIYNDHPSQEKINQRINMFTKTYENMMDFIEKGSVQEIYNQLKKY